MAAYLLDANVISSLIKRNEDGKRVGGRLADVLRQNATVLISGVVYYEVARGLHHLASTQSGAGSRQLAFLMTLAGNLKWCDLDMDTWEEGARLWAKCRSHGTPTGAGLDKDVLIAAQARRNNAVIVTNNARHMRLLEVSHENW